MTPFQKYLLLSLLVALLNGILLLIFFIPRFSPIADSQQYSATIKYLAGDSEGELFPYAILKPFSLLPGVILLSVLNPEKVLMIQNLIFYLLSAWLVFLIVYYFYQKEKQAFYGTVLFVTAYPVLAYGLVPMIDMPGWFFYLLSVWLSLNFLKNPEIKKAVFLGFLAGLGLLFKETVAAAPLFFTGLVFLAAKLSWKEKLKRIFAFGLAFLPPVLISSLLIYRLYSYSYWHWYKDVWAHSGTTFYAYTPLRIVVETGRVFLTGWLFVLLGLLKELANKNIERLKILAAFVLPSLSVFLWSYPHNRMLYIAAPLLVVLASFGILRNYQNSKINVFTELILLFLYVFTNYLALEFFLRYGGVLGDKF